MHNVTLQINLSPGDITYAGITVPFLAKAHQANVDEKLAIVNCCRPQKTKIVDPDKKFPELEYSYQVKEICIIAEKLKRKGYLDRIVYLYPGDSLISLAYHKYMGGWLRINDTHDYGGGGLIPYFAGLAAANTRYVLHYDPDMLLYQAPGYDWSVEAKHLMNKQDKIISASPRISPLFSKEQGVADAPSLHEGSVPTPVEGGWQNSWISGRCYFLDHEKLSKYLPLTQGKALLELLAVKYLNRGYPKAFEVILSNRTKAAGCWRLDLNSQQAWLLHPKTKPPRYIELLPDIIEAVLQGQVPPKQRGYADINLSIWEEFLATSKPRHYANTNQLKQLDNSNTNININLPTTENLFSQEVEKNQVFNKQE